MIEIMRAQDMVRLSYISSLLEAAGLHPQIFDQHMAILEGSITAIEKRIMMPPHEAEEAIALLREAGELDAEKER